MIQLLQFGADAQKIGEFLIEQGCKLFLRDGTPILFAPNLKQHPAQDVVILEDQFYSRVAERLKKNFTKVATVTRPIAQGPACPNCNNRWTPVTLAEGLKAVYCESCRHVDYAPEIKESRTKEALTLIGNPAKVLVTCDSTGICEIK